MLQVNFDIVVIDRDPSSQKTLLGITAVALDT